MGEDRLQPPDPLRPRFGLLIRRTGEQVLLVFHPTDDPNVFLACRADTEEPVHAAAGDRLKVDALGAGQGIAFAAA